MYIPSTLTCKYRFLLFFQEISTNSVVFDDGSVAHDVDVIINCTGYTIDLPFLSDDITDLIVDSESNDLKVKLGASIHS